MITCNPTELRYTVNPYRCFVAVASARALALALETAGNIDCQCRAAHMATEATGAAVAQQLAAGGRGANVI